MALDGEWNQVETVLKKMESYRLYQTTARALRPVIEKLRASPEFSQAYVRMTLHDFSLSRMQTGLFVSVYWNDERGYHIGIGKPPLEPATVENINTTYKEEYWGLRYTFDEAELLDILRDYLKHT